MGRSEPLDQGVAGFMVQLLERGSSDAQRGALGRGLKGPRPFAQQLEHNLTHGGGRSRRPVHPWAAGGFRQVPRHTENRSTAHPRPV